MKIVFGIIAFVTVNIFTPPSFAQEPIFSKITGASGEGEKDWTSYLADTASGSISAAGMLGISGDSISSIENVRDIVVAVKGLSSDQSKATLALSITPARTSISPMDLSTYAHSWPARLLGSLTFGYAQGDATISEINYERRAVSIETNMFFNARNDDPVVAFAEAVKKGVGDCAILQEEQPVAPIPSSEKQGENGVAVPSVAPDDTANAAKKRATACRDGVMKLLRWNRSQFSVAYATGWIKPNSGDGNEETLGKTAVIGLIYGFDQIPSFRERLAAAVTYRRTFDEPVLDSLQSGSINKMDSSLAVFRLSGGSNKVRALAEVSNARSSNITASQRAFKQALGLDIRVYEATWLNFRIGKQRKIDGTDDEVGSIISLSYSPTALLK